MGKFSKMQDMELVVFLRDGSVPAFEELYSRYKGKLMYFYKQTLKNDTGSEDMVHDIFLHIWNTRGSLIKLSFSGYVFSLLKNSILKQIRHFDVHSRFARNLLMNANDSTNQTEDCIIEDDYEKLMNKLVECLSPRQKEIYHLSRVQGFTYKEIAEQLEISVETVREHASLVLKKIKKCLEQHADIHF